MVILQHSQQVRDLADEDAKCPCQLTRRGCHGDSTVLIGLYGGGDGGRAAQGHRVNIDETGGACKLWVK